MEGESSGYSARAAVAATAAAATAAATVTAVAAAPLVGQSTSRCVSALHTTGVKRNRKAVATIPSTAQTTETTIINTPPVTTSSRGGDKQTKMRPRRGHPTATDSTPCRLPTNPPPPAEREAPALQQDGRNATPSTGGRGLRRERGGFSSQEPHFEPDSGPDSEPDSEQNWEPDSGQGQKPGVRPDEGRAEKKRRRGRGIGGGEGRAGGLSWESSLSVKTELVANYSHLGTYEEGTVCACTFVFGRRERGVGWRGEAAGVGSMRFFFLGFLFFVFT